MQPARIITIDNKISPEERKNDDFSYGPLKDNKERPKAAVSLERYGSQAPQVPQAWPTNRQEAKPKKGPPDSDNDPSSEEESGTGHGKCHQWRRRGEE